MRDPDLDNQHLSARRALEEVDRIRRVTLDAEGTTIELVTRRSALQEHILKAFGVDTSPGPAPPSTDPTHQLRSRARQGL